MIYGQTFLSYLFAAIFTLLLAVRMKDYLKLYFETSFAWIITLVVIFHPFSIEAFLAPNPYSGPLAFLLFFEAQFFFLNKKYHKGMLALFFAAILNINFCLFPVYYFYKHRRELKNIFWPVVIYFFLVSMYAYQHTLDLWKNPIFFLSHFIQNIFLPVSLSLFDYSLLPFDFYIFLFSALLLLFFLWRQKNNTQNKTHSFWPLILLPSIGIMWHQWIFKYQFWDEIIFNSSNFMCITFSVITLMAFNFPRKLFYALSIFILFISLETSLKWYPLSSHIDQNITDLPDNYSELATTKRLLAWQFIYEGNKAEGKRILHLLLEENKSNEKLKNSLIQDLKIFEITQGKK